jgi:hypothetical protein
MKTTYQVRYVFLGVLLLLSGLAQAKEITSSAAFNPRGVERPTHSFKFSNDLYFGTDSGITGSLALQKHSSVARSWQAVEGLPHFIDRWGPKIPTITAEGLFYRSSFALGTITQTPDEIQRSELIKNDVPYAGVLALEASWYGFNDDEFRGFEFVVGVLGPAALGKQLQTTAHKLTGANRPRGWRHQLKNEPIINLNYMRKKKISRMGNPTGWAFDTAFSGNASLGNLVTKVTSSIEMRWGHNMPQGFTFIPDPIGFGMNYKAALKPANPRAAAYYGSLTLRGTGVLYNVLLDGNTFRNSHSVDKEPVFGEVIFGFHYERESWSVHLDTVFATDEVNTSQVTDVDNGRMIGSLTIEWRL